METNGWINGDENGNTSSSPAKSIDSKKKRVSQLKYWEFTLNNYLETDIQQILSFIKSWQSKIAKWGFQEEMGAEGTPHLQGAIWFHQAHRWSEFKLTKNLSWRGIRNEQAMEDYVQKSKTCIGRRWNAGLTDPLDIIEVLCPWQKTLENLFFEKPHKRHIHYFWRKLGGSGKSDFVKYMVFHHGVMFCRGGEARDLINLCINQNMRKVKCIIWDLPRKTGNKISYEALECIKDGLICNTKFECKATIFNRPHIFIFGNMPPKEDLDEVNMSSDKFQVFQLPEDNNDVFWDFYREKCLIDLDGIDEPIPDIE